MKLANPDILRLLPAHISGDPQFAATGQAANPVLAKMARAVPNLLLWARLGKQDPQTFLPPLRRLTEARGGLDPLNTETLESLAWQFHVDFREVAKSDEKLAGLILRSIAWHRIKGTPKSIYDALFLCGFGTRYSQGEQPKNYGIFIEEGGPQVHWATYQLGFEEIADLEDLKAIVKICREMQPARCRLWRVYTLDFDVRPGCWSGPLPQNAWSNAWWSIWSGSYIPEIPGLDDRGLLVSWGKRLRVLSEGWSENRRVAVFQEKLRTLRCFMRTFPRWSEAHWSDFVSQKPPSFVFWNGHGLMVGELMGGESWQNLLWPNRNWGGEYHALKGQFFTDICSINSLFVQNPGWWPSWPDEGWPDANWLYGHETGWADKPWLDLPWDFGLRLCDLRLHGSIDSILPVTAGDFHAQPGWHDGSWPEWTWGGRKIIGRPALFRSEHIQCAQIGEPVWQENLWSDEAWPERVWANSWQLAYRDCLPWSGEKWLDAPWASGSGIMAGDCAFCAWDCITASVFPEGCLEHWPDSEWPELPWDGSFRQIKPEIRLLRSEILASAANSDGAQRQWQDRPWADEVWFSPKVTGRKTSFTFVSEISPDAIWLDISWPDCRWQSTQLEDA